MGLRLEIPGRDRYRVYLSISKEARKEDIEKTLKYLECFNVNVYTYDGSNYNLDDLNDMDAVLFLTGYTRTPELQPDSVAYSVGKGQYSEAEHVDTVLGENIYVISDLENGIHVDELAWWEEKEFGIQNWRMYGSFYTYGQNIELVNYAFFVAHGPYYEMKEESEVIVKPANVNGLHLALLNAKHLL